MIKIKVFIYNNKFSKFILTQISSNDKMKNLKSINYYFFNNILFLFI